MIAIVGGGASGTLTASHLLDVATEAAVPLRLVLIDRFGRHGLGQAYATSDPCHLLNATADRMSAYDGDPGHLLRWTRETGTDRDGADFLSRGVFGRYLCHVLAAAEQRARPVAALSRLTATVTAVSGGARGHRPLRLQLSHGGRLDVDVVVLAVGNPAPALQVGEDTGPRYIADPWAPDALTAVNDDAPVLVVGTGLTMIDVATTLTAARPGTTVYAVSRHGLLPRRHRCPSPPPSTLSLPDGPTDLASLMSAVRAAVAANGGEWRGVVDGLRPLIPDLWARLSRADQRVFLDRLARYWEVHRHRVAPETAERITVLRSSGRLRVLRGRVDALLPVRAGVRARITQGADRRDLRVGWVVNGTGPAGNITESHDPLMRHLLESRLVRPDGLGIGLDAAPDGALRDGRGRPHDRIFALGPPLRGLRYETTAVPEIRGQAAALADRLLASLRPEPSGVAIVP